MIHFPSSLPRRSDSLQLNATQQKQPTHKIFLTVEEELHDARRVHSHGQEEDLRLALNMLIDRLSQLSTMLSDAYKTNADLEVQLNVAKSNLQLVISNNEMLEDALKRGDASARDVGWRRSSARSHTIDDAPSLSSPRVPGASTPTHSATPSGEFTAPDPPVSPSAPASSSTTTTTTTQESSRFFKFRFTGSSPNPGSSTASASSSRPGTPSPAIPHLGSPAVSSKEKEELEKELEKERAARKQAKKEKEELEAELEALSQALFEEANKMVASERIRRADIEEELREATLEKEALRSALKLLEGENSHLRSASSSPAVPPPSTSTSDSTSTSAPPSSQDTLSTSGTPPDHADRDTNAHIPPSPPSTSSSPRTQHLPPSLSSLPTRLPPPQPLAIPTTPFSWAEGDVPTPRWRAGRLSMSGDAEGGEEAEEQKASEERGAGTQEKEEARVPPPPSPPPPPPATLPSETHILQGTRGAEPDTPPTPPPPPPEHEHEHRSSATPPLHHLFAPHEHEHEHERDPWADAASVGAVQY